MNHRFHKNTAGIVFAAILLAEVPEVRACTWVAGYFYQVSTLKGTVVGTNATLLHSIRWFRQSIDRQNAKLTLYD